MQVDKNVNLMVTNAFGCLLVIHGADADMVIHGGNHARPQRCAVFFGPAKTIDFNFFSIVQFKQLGNQYRDGVRAKIR
ncbi:hypothetical protein GALL_463360 [mine drainage metagenome]|uniref:Uncharacterized protein n=1 Tax=mine drainage metagenome TaxID=410659 RepID=A0A1J5Q3K5_9ZZZZ